MSADDFRRGEPTLAPDGDLAMDLPWQRARAADPTPIRREDVPYLKDLNEALIAQATPASSAMLYLITLLLVAAIGWASVARVEEITKADAKVVTAGREQVISSLEGGLLAAMLVREGEVVEAGQPLLRLEDTRFRAQYREGMTRALALKASIARLRAEATGATPVFPRDVAESRSLVRDETAAFVARQQSLRDALESLRRNQALLNGELASSERLAAKGLFSSVELSRLRRQVNELQAQIDDRRNRFRADANAELLKLEAELAQLNENLAARQDSFERTTLKAPIRGVVKTIRAGTVGGTIQPGAPILELLPVDGDLLLEARLKPADVAFVHEGLHAKIKLTAFDYGVYGDLDGVVTQVSPDTLRDEQRPQQPDSTYYKVIVRTDTPAMRAGEHLMPILPGMQGTVEIRTGEKTVLDYLLKPMLKAREAFRER